MPHKGQRKSTNSNKKKKPVKNGEEKTGINTLELNPPLNQPVNGSNQSSRNSSNSTNSDSQLDDLSDSVYVRYKKSTQRFKEALQALVPSQIFESDRVHVLMDAADYVSENALSVNEELLQDLKFTIRVRKRIACEKFDGGDSGHSFFIAVLSYCWSVLAPLCPRKKTDETIVDSTCRHPKDEGKSSFHNRFASLAIGDGDQGEEDAEDDLSQYSSKPSRPVETKPTELTLQEIMSATDFTDCQLFLLTMDKYMEFNCRQYSMLKEKCNSNIGSKESPSSIVRDLIQIGVGTNTAIQRLAALEQRFNHDYPHLNTPYRMLAKLVFPEVVRDLFQIVQKQSTIAAQFKDSDAVIFIGDTLECGFRDKYDPNNKFSNLVHEFCNRWKVTDTSGVDKLFQEVYKSLVDETPFKQEAALIQKKNQEIARLIQLLSPEVRRQLEGCAISNPNHSWLLPYRFIGGKQRSILHTLRLLQSLPLNITATKGCLRLQPGSLGPSWDKIVKRPISAIPLEMDELLMGDIIPVLINICYEGYPARNMFPMKEELLPLFCHIELLIKYPDRPVTWTLVFAIHSILSSIFETQGAKTLSYIADTASSAFNKYNQQIKLVNESVMPLALRRPRPYETNLRTAVSLEHLLLVPMHTDNIYTLTDGQMQRALWNPVCAGCTLAFIAYFGNVGVGSAMVDSVIQFRAWMHIYNALIQTGHVTRGEVPFLDFLYDKFENSKAIWEGPLPVRGQFVTRAMISFGMSVDAAQNYIASPIQKSQARNNRLRTVTPIEPQSFMKSYQRICLREYTDDRDNYQSDEQSQDWERLFNTMNAIEDDEQVLAFNWASIGHYLSDALGKLFDLCGLMSETDSLIDNTSDEAELGRRVDLRVVVSADSWLESDEKYRAIGHILARLLFDPLDREGTDILAVHAATQMKNYFVNIPMNKMQWFDLA